MRFSVLGLLAGLLLLVVSVQAAEIKVLRVQTDWLFDVGEPLSNVRILLQNNGTNCGDGGKLEGTLETEILTEDRQSLGIPIARYRFALAQGEQQEFVLNAAHLPDISNLSPGTFVLSVIALCPAYQDQKSAFFAVGGSGSINVPETNPIVLAFLLLAVLGLLFNPKK